MRTWCCRRRRRSKGWDIYEHGAAHPTGVQGAGAAGRVEGRLGDHRADREPYGREVELQHPSEIMDEIAKLTPLFAGVSYERLDGYKSQQWPVHAAWDRSAAVTEKFPFDDGKARFYPVEGISRPRR